MPSINRTSTNHSMAGNTLVPLELLHLVPRSPSPYSRLHIQVWYARFFTQTEAIHIKGEFEVVNVPALYYRRSPMLSVHCCPTEQIPDIRLPHGQVRVIEHAIAGMLYDSYESCCGLPVIRARKLEIKMFIRFEIPVRSSL